MSSKVIGVRRWVAMTVLSAALVAGGIFGVWAMNWSGHTVLGACESGVEDGGEPESGESRIILEWILCDREAGASRGRWDFVVEDGEDAHGRAAVFE